MRREPGSFYYHAVDMLTRAHPDKTPLWAHQQACDLVNMCRAGGGNAIIPAEALEQWNEHDREQPERHPQREQPDPA